MTDTWEYKTIWSYSDNDINRAGAEGWEACGVGGRYGDTVLLKRRVSAEEREIAELRTRLVAYEAENAKLNDWLKKAREREAAAKKALKDAEEAARNVGELLQLLQHPQQDNELARRVDAAFAAAGRGGVPKSGGLEPRG